MNLSEYFPLNAIILAGGKSSRMGQDKALLSWQNVSFLQRIVDITESFCVQTYIVTPWPERYQNITGSSVQFLSEDPPDQGSLVAFSQGLQKIPPQQATDWILLLACDLPYLEPNILNNWCLQLPSMDSDILAVVPQNQGYWEPLCAFYRSSIQTQIDDYLQTGKRSFQELLQQIPVHKNPVDDRIKKMFFNCNTPEDLSSLGN